MVVYTHSHWKYIRTSSIVRIGTLGKASEILELSHKNIPFATVCGHINYVNFSMLITWISIIGSLIDRNH